MQDLIRKRPGVIATRVGYTGGDVSERDLPQPRHPRRGDRDRVRSRADFLPRATRVLLPDPRPDDAEPSGQRRRNELPVGDLLPGRRAAPVAEDTIADVEASGLWPGKVVTEVAPGGSVLGGRARAPGLPRALPERLHVPLPAARLGAPAPQRRRPLAALRRVGRQRPTEEQRWTPRRPPSCSSRSPAHRAAAARADREGSGGPRRRQRARRHVRRG